MKTINFNLRYTGVTCVSAKLADAIHKETEGGKHPTRLASKKRAWKAIVQLRSHDSASDNARSREKVTVRRRGNLRTTTNGAFRHNARIYKPSCASATASLAMENTGAGDLRAVGEIVEKHQRVSESKFPYSHRH